MGIPPYEPERDRELQAQVAEEAQTTEQATFEQFTEEPIDGNMARPEPDSTDAQDGAYANLTEVLYDE